MKIQSNIPAVAPEISVRFKNFSLLAAIMVVFIHVPHRGLAANYSWLMNLLPVGICKIAVPFFFMAAGFFFAGHVGETGWWCDSLRKRYKSLLVPYVIWGVLYSVLLCIATYFDPSVEISKALNPLNILGLIPWEQPNLKLLWFVRALLMCALLSPGLLCVARVPYGLGVLLLGAISCAGGVDFGLFVYGVLSIKGFFYFSLGLWLRFNYKVVKFMEIGSMSILLCSTIGFVSSVFFKWRWGGDILTCLLTMSAPFAAPIVVRWAPLLSLSFPICLVHRFVMLPIRFLIAELSGRSIPCNPFWYFLFAVLTIMLTVAIVALMKRYLPRFYSVAFGGR